MLCISFGGLVLTAFIHVIHRLSLFTGMEHHEYHVALSEFSTSHGLPPYYVAISSVAFFIPLGCFLYSVYLYYKTPYHEKLPLWITITLTLSSINMVMGGDGMMEYHFSIFIVIALVAFYDRIRLIVIMSVIFTVQHVLGYFVSPITYFVFGVAGYSFAMTMVHMVAVTLMAVAIITQIKTRQTLFEESETDHLTNILNRRAILKKIYTCHDENPGRTCSMIFFDLDHFKQINDTYGHEAGDELLIHFTKLLDSEVADKGLFARYGGEEFVLFLPEYSKVDAFNYAEEIRKKIEQEPFSIKNHLSYKEESFDLQATASIGVASYPEQCSQIDDLIRYADRAMYVGSKLKGRNRVSLFDASME